MIKRKRGKNKKRRMCQPVRNANQSIVDLWRSRFYELLCKAGNSGRGTRRSTHILTSWVLLFTRYTYAFLQSLPFPSSVGE